MHVKDYLHAYLKDWIALMSGAASVAFTFWAALAEPSSAGLRRGLWIVSVLCLFTGSYKVWATERGEVVRLNEKANGDADQVAREFEEIKANILLSTLGDEIGAQLKILKAFLHKHSFLLNQHDVADFYGSYISPHEIALRHGASLDLTQAQYAQMKEELVKINLFNRVSEGVPPRGSVSRTV